MSAKIPITRSVLVSLIASITGAATCSSRLGRSSRNGGPSDEDVFMLNLLGTGNYNGCEDDKRWCWIRTKILCVWRRKCGRTDVTEEDEEKEQKVHRHRTTSFTFYRRS
jgi:hypothetical protein